MAKLGPPTIGSLSYAVSRARGFFFNSTTTLMRGALCIRLISPSYPAAAEEIIGRLKIDSLYVAANHYFNLEEFHFD